MTEEIHTNERNTETQTDVSVSAAIGSAREIARLTEAIDRSERAVSEAATVRQERESELQYARTSFSLVSERTNEARAAFDADESTKDVYLKAEAEERSAHADVQRAERRASAAASIELSARAELEGLRASHARAERHGAFVLASEKEARAASHLATAKTRLRKAMLAEADAHAAWRAARIECAVTHVGREHADINEPSAREAILRVRATVQLSADVDRVADFFLRAREAIVDGLDHHKGQHFGAELSEAREALVALVGRDQVPRVPTPADIARGLNREHGEEANHAIASALPRIDLSLKHHAMLIRVREQTAEEERDAERQRVAEEERLAAMPEPTEEELAEQADRAAEKAREEARREAFRGPVQLA